jgi:hypothetical protein
VVAVIKGYWESFFSSENGFVPSQIIALLSPHDPAFEREADAMQAQVCLREAAVSMKKLGPIMSLKSPVSTYVRLAPAVRTMFSTHPQVIFFLFSRQI